MVNKLVDVGLYILDFLFGTQAWQDYFDFWIDLTGYIADYRYQLTQILEGIYFFLGKTMVVFIWDYSIAVFCIAIVFALIYIIGQYVP